MFPLPVHTSEASATAPEGQRNTTWLDRFSSAGAGVRHMTGHRVPTDVLALMREAMSSACAPRAMTAAAWPPDGARSRYAGIGG